MSADTPSTVNGEQNPLQVAIIGAGIGGLTLAVALSRLIPEESIRVDIYEQVEEIKEIGAGILFWPRTWPILQNLGVTDALEKLLENKPDFTEKELNLKIVKSDQRKSIDLYEMYHYGKPLQFHRAAVQRTLLDSLPSSVQIHLTHRLISYDESDEEVVLHFDNGLSQKCDLLVAADGIKSHIRGEFISKRIPDQMKSVKPVWGGITSYRSLIDASKIREKFPEHLSLYKPTLYAGVEKFIISYPIMKGRIVNIGAQVADYSKEGTVYRRPERQETDKEYLLSLYDGWSEECVELLKNAESFSQWSIQHLNPLRKYAVGRIALLGDAAHAMPPTQGSGAGQAVEDAYTLAHLILKATENKIPIHRVTEAYTTVRQPLANHVLQKSLDAARLTTFSAAGYEGINDADNETLKGLPERWGKEYAALYEWMNIYLVEEEVEKALKALTL